MNAASVVETLFWQDNTLKMVDQRILPISLKYISADSAATVAKAIRDMVIRGAPAIGVAAAYGIAIEAMNLAKTAPDQFHEKLSQSFDLLSQSRPTAVNLFWALNRMQQALASLTHLSPAAIAQKLLSLAHQIKQEDIQINQKMGNYGASLLPDHARVMTHCNAGALATAGHGTALGVFRSAVAQGKSISVIANETRPFLQGARLTAWEMIQENIPVTLITDNMAGYMMQTGEIDAVVVGADRVAANGDVANKIGTYMIAVLAHRHHIPFYVACPVSTIDLAISSGKDIPIEERDINEVKGFQDYHWAAKGAAIRNPAFDVTPAELITALITEKGIISNHILTSGKLSAFLEKGDSE